MSKPTRKSGFPQKPTKNAKKSADSPPAEPGYNPAQEKGRFRAKKYKNMRPTRSRGTKAHSGLSAPVSPKKAGGRQSGGVNTSKYAPEGWIYGHHAAKAALENPKRTIHAIHASENMAAKLNLHEGQNHRGAPVTLLHPSEIDKLLPGNAVHQGIAVHCAPLPSAHLDEIASPAKGLILVLDQITDPHNVGAMFRLASAFAAKAVIMQDRHAPPLAGATAKVAVGTMEAVPHVLVTNIANTLLSLQKSGWRVTGLAGEADVVLGGAFPMAEAEVLVVGAEGPGLRKRVRDCCDQLANIPMPGSMVYDTESLNVSTAAGIALYEASRNLIQD